ncbi:hypothetical protein NKG05_08105 [Oerskovia sp. M15]
MAAQAAGALDVVLHLRRAGRVRHLAEIGVVARDARGELVVEPVATWDGLREPVRTGGWDAFADRWGGRDGRARGRVRGVGSGRARRRRAAEVGTVRVSGRGLGLRKFGPRRVAPPASVRLLVAHVAALLRSGAAPGPAWATAAGVRVDPQGVPDRSDLLAVVGGREVQDAQAQVAAVVAASRLAADVGAPLGAVLESIAHALSAEAEARADREASLAGPQATARVLLWLPAVGVVLGTVLGVDPVATALGGGVGSAGLVAGGVLLMVGRRWSGRLVARARAAGRRRERGPGARGGARGRVPGRGSPWWIARAGVRARLDGLTGALRRRAWHRGRPGRWRSASCSSCWRGGARGDERPARPGGRRSGDRRARRRSSPSRGAAVVLGAGWAEAWSGAPGGWPWCVRPWPLPGNRVRRRGVVAGGGRAAAS